MCMSECLYVSVVLCAFVCACGLCCYVSTAPFACGTFLCACGSVHVCMFLVPFVLIF